MVTILLMTARTHDLAAFTGLVAVIAYLPLPAINLSTLLLGLLLNQIGGIVPDIDQPAAPLWRNLPIGRFIGKIVGGSLGGHRFVSHSLLGVALFGFVLRVVLGYLTPVLGHANTGYLWWAFMIGMVSHLIMDTLTKDGVPWLLPWGFKFGFPPLRRLRIHTGSWVELFVVFPLLIGINVWLVGSHHTTFSHLLQQVR